MGGRGSNITFNNVNNTSNKTATQNISVQNQQSTSQAIQDVIDASKMPSVYGNNTVSMFNGMSDDQMANALNASKGVQMPNHIADIYDNTQNFVYANQLNAKPTVLDDVSFNQFMKQNGISDKDILIREVDSVKFKSNGVQFTYTADDITDMFKTSDINYIGGKRGGQVYGAGTYFGQVGKGGSTHYGQVPMMAVFNPKTAKVIRVYDIDSKWNAFVLKNPKTGKAFNSSFSHKDISVKALLMGYNVISQGKTGNLSSRGGCYYNIIDRSALVVRARNGNT